MIDPQIQQLIAYLNTIPSVERGDIIRKIKLFAQCDARPYQTGTRTSHQGKTITHFLPPLSRMDVVHCDFTGVGYEWDGPHYAVVWNVNPIFDSVTVIPTTSETREEYANIFSVGQINGLPLGKTTLLVADTTTVSRKRITPVTYVHPRRRRVESARLPNAWIDRVYQAMAVNFAGETTFQEFVIRGTGVAMPEDLAVLYAWRFIPIQGSYDATNNILNFRIWNKADNHTVQFLLPKQQISLSVKQQLVRNLFSGDAGARATAQSQYETLYR